MKMLMIPLMCVVLLGCQSQTQNSQNPELGTTAEEVKEEEGDSQAHTTEGEIEEYPNQNKRRTKMNGEQKSQLASVEPGGIFLFDHPNTPAELSKDSPTVGHPRRPLETGDAKCGLVTIIGPEGHADFSPIEDPVQVAIVLALFELKRASLK